MLEPGRNLPVWIKAENGVYVNLANMDALLVDDLDADGAPVRVIASNSKEDYLLATCESEEAAEDVLRTLVGILPIAVVDISLDVIAEVQRAAREAGP